MSQTVQDFYDKVTSSPELKERVKAIQLSSAESLAELARTSGFALTAADFFADREISDAALTDVSGGIMVQRKKLVSTGDGMVRYQDVGPAIPLFSSEKSK